MTFFIITPSLRNSDWLKLCIASVADQQVDAEHIVQDACSDDGTLDWLPHDKRVKAFIEKDSGMYDAVNRGLRKAIGEILAYLNCDEQYLPGALQRVVKIYSPRSCRGDLSDGVSKGERCSSPLWSPHGVTYPVVAKSIDFF
jgi:glycosyltransferase involved in cell wall biosynthesis